MVGIANGGLIMDIEAPLDRLAIPKSKGDRGLGKERPQRPYSIFGRELDISRVQIGPPIPDASLISISSPIIPIMDESADHRDPRQWRFYVIPTTRLPARKTISLVKVALLSDAVPWIGLKGAIESLRAIL
jgi:hypothetical protein